MILPDPYNMDPFLSHKSWYLGNQLDLYQILYSHGMPSLFHFFWISFRCFLSVKDNKHFNVKKLLTGRFLLLPFVQRVICVF